MGLLSEDYGKHLLGVEDLLQKHSLVEADIAAQADRVKSVNEQAEVFLHLDNEDDGMCKILLCCRWWQIVAWWVLFWCDAWPLTVWLTLAWISISLSHTLPNRHLKTQAANTIQWHQVTVLTSFLKCTTQGDGWNSGKAYTSKHDL